MLCPLLWQCRVRMERSIAASLVSLRLSDYTRSSSPRIQVRETTTTSVMMRLISVRKGRTSVFNSPISCVCVYLSSRYRTRSMSLNCSSETNAIDSNTVSIKYIVGGWLTLIFCLFGTNEKVRQAVRSSAVLFPRQVF